MKGLLSVEPTEEEIKATVGVVTDVFFQNDARMSDDRWRSRVSEIRKTLLFFLRNPGPWVSSWGIGAEIFSISLIFEPLFVKTKAI